MENMKGLVEAMIFAAGLPLERREIVSKIPGLTTRELNKVLAELSLKYTTEGGVHLLTYGDKVEFSSNPIFGEFLSEALQKIRERELTKNLLEVLSIIAYKQPITRGELEEFRSRSADYAISTLLRVGLIKEVGKKKDAIGHPMLFGTTDEFLRKFSLRSLSDMPDYEETLEKIKSLDRYNPQSEGLFRDREVYFDVSVAEQDNPDARISGDDLTVRAGFESFAEIAADVDRKLKDFHHLDFDFDAEKPDFLSPDDDINIIE